MKYTIWVRKDPAPMAYLAIETGDPSVGKTYLRCGWEKRGEIETDMTAEALTELLARDAVMERDRLSMKLHQIQTIVNGFDSMGR